MLIAQSFVERLRVGTFAIGWLYAITLLLGLGIGPTIGYFFENDGAVVAQAAGGTALIVLGMGATGFAMSATGRFTIPSIAGHCRRHAR